MEIEECFRVLEVSPTASVAEVRNGYRTLVSVWHPDRFTGNQALQARAEQKLKSINEAFETLEAAGFPSLPAESQRSVPTIETSAEAAPAPSPRVHATLRWTIIAVSVVVIWIDNSGRPIGERIFNSLVGAFLLWILFSRVILSVAWSLLSVSGAAKTRPQTWIVLTGASVVSAAMVAWLLNRDPSLGPVLVMVGLVVGALILVVWFYLRSRPKQSLRTRIWNRLVGFGFLAMLFGVAIATGFDSPALAIAVSWIYWFGWTWLSWIIAGRLAVKGNS